MDALPEKSLYTIGEVSEFLKIETHVLRYWETKFPDNIKPTKRNDRRLYRRQDIDIISEVKYLLYTKGFKIEGAIKSMKSKKKENADKNHSMLLDLKKKLSNMKQDIEKAMEENIIGV